MAKPNILVLMMDQLNGTLFPDGPARWLHTPNLRKISEQSLRFANSYTASPLCTPARASFMTGQLPSETGVYDNAAGIDRFNANLRSSSATCRIPDIADRKNAFCWARSTTWI